MINSFKVICPQCRKRLSETPDVKDSPKTVAAVSVPQPKAVAVVSMFQPEVVEAVSMPLPEVVAAVSTPQQEAAVAAAAADVTCAMPKMLTVTGFLPEVDS